eukprot:jgi/Botrbrau1/21327/Bobra.0184s0037.1
MSNGCCTPSGPSSNPSVRTNVKEYYGEVLKKKEDLKTTACTAAGRPDPIIIESLNKVPQEVLSKFYGCGTPIPLGIQGLRVLDLGCGSGRDCYVAAALVGGEGSVIGIDMTRSQLEVAERHVADYCASLGYSAPNLRFVEGYIEDLKGAGIPDESVDLIISNCVVNLSPNKEQVLREAYRVLAVGGEFHFSDMYVDRRIPEKAKRDKVLWGEGIGGALYVNDFLDMAKAAGFTYPVMESPPALISIMDPEMRALSGNTQAYSITYRLFKLPGLLEPNCEEYGQAVIYKGTMPGQELEYRLDVKHAFEKGRIMPVCGNTAALLGEDGLSWLAPHFKVLGSRETHFGPFRSGSSNEAVVLAGSSTQSAQPLGVSCC